MKQFLTTILIVAVVTICSAQEAEEDHSHDHEGHVHNEIGIANGLSYSFNEKISHYGVHFHFVKGLSCTFGLGLGYEAIIGDHLHQTLVPFLKVNPCNHFSFNIGPGLTFPTEEHDEYEFSIHTEAIAFFEVGQFHMGPMVGLGLAPEDKHISFGFHVAYGF